jgi:hypothetical protein
MEYDMKGNVKPPPGESKTLLSKIVSKLGGG